MCHPLSLSGRYEWDGGSGAHSGRQECCWIASGGYECAESWGDGGGGQILARVLDSEAATAPVGTGKFSDCGEGKAVVGDGNH